MPHYIEMLEHIHEVPFHLSYIGFSSTNRRHSHIERTLRELIGRRCQTVCIPLISICAPENIVVAVLHDFPVGILSVRRISEQSGCAGVLRRSSAVRFGQCSGSKRVVHGIVAHAQIVYLHVVRVAGELPAVNVGHVRLHRILQVCMRSCRISVGCLCVLAYICITIVRAVVHIIDALEGILVHRIGSEELLPLLFLAPEIRQSLCRNWSCQRTVAIESIVAESVRIVVGSAIIIVRHGQHVGRNAAVGSGTVQRKGILLIVFPLRGAIFTEHAEGHHDVGERPRGVGVAVDGLARSLVDGNEIAALAWQHQFKLHAVGIIVYHHRCSFAAHILPGVAAIEVHSVGIANESKLMVMVGHLSCRSAGAD